MAMIRSLTRQIAGLAVAQPRVGASAASTTLARSSLAAPASRQTMATMASSPLLLATRVAFPSSVGKKTPMAMPVRQQQLQLQQTRAMGYKLKSKSSVKKRFRVNSNGVVKRNQANKRHIATKKTRERIRRLGKTVFVQGKIRKNILRMLPGRG